jgi:hypothetical protein
MTTLHRNSFSIVRPKRYSVLNRSIAYWTSTMFYLQNKMYFHFSNILINQSTCDQKRAQQCFQLKIKINYFLSAYNTNYINKTYCLLNL